MTALSLFDSVLAAASRPPGGAPADPARLAGVAQRLVHAALAELAEIEALDACLAAPDADRFDAQTAVLLRGMYEQWTRDADPVLERVNKIRRMGLTVPNADALADAQGRLFAMLQVTPEDVERGRRQHRQTRTWSREEIRAQLGLGV